MTKLVFSDEWLRDYEKRTGLGEHGKANQKPVSAVQKPEKRSITEGGASAPTSDSRNRRSPGRVTATGVSPGRSKYGNKRTEYNGRVFDSVHEAEVYKQLDFRVLRASCGA